MKSATKAFFGLVVNVGRRADLLDHTAVHHHHGVGHGQGLFLVVGDEDKGDPRLLLDLLQLHLHVLAQLQVQGAQGLVQQQHLGLVGQGSCDGHPLLLPAGQLAHPPVGEARQVHHVQHPLDGLLHFLLALFLQAHPEGDVVVHVQVGEQGVLLEDGVHLPLVRGQGGDVFPIKKDLAGVRGDKPGDGAQGRGLATARGAQQGDELPVPDVQVKALEYLLAIEGNRDVFQGNDGVLQG